MTMDGIFAVNKPSGPSSGDVVSDLKHYFSKSPVFAEDIKKIQGNQPPSKRKKKKNQFIKIGHGGTLDPLASGVLVIGIGAGTKKLGDYLGSCTKTYRAKALFGTSTDTYDSQGKIVDRASVKHLTNEKVEKALEKFRGDILQTPPVYSALKMNGKPLYEYARSGEELPKEIKPRECKIDSLEVVGGGLVYEHEFKHPETEASEQEKKYSHILNKLDKQSSVLKEGEENSEDSSAEEVDLSSSPILEIKFSVSSGTYIRSLIHDIGLELGTTAHMVELTREVQGPWELNTNVFEITDFTKRDPEKWEPELRHYLDNGPNTPLKEVRN
ncbi:hypothetical protein TRICI_006455 [Trichomonascus ciferrii]|uniref:tRNA pseudouridine(55) synthase n=1 Tax=Trichomonascus ciferrii TaxID=44093 RepID=A0A642UH39_9ASCO|nr:hypothetical protein TRICI_006455 [Trichomonascus ciferrii]